MATGMVSRSDAGLTISLPDDLGLPEGEVDVSRHGDDVVITPRAGRGDQGTIDVDRIVALLNEIPDDVFEAIEAARRADRTRAP